jgi:acetyltransferase-like isoleucine patch superfamily enzyme
MRVDRDMTRPDPVTYFARLSTKLHTEWLRLTYGFYGFGPGTSIHSSCEIARESASRIAFGSRVYLAPDVWLNVEPGAASGPAIALGSGCRIGRRSVISAKNQITLEDDVLLAPNVLLMDHNHEYSGIEAPIHAQGTTLGGTIRVECNCWLGYGAVIVCGKGVLTIGRNSVIGANTVITRSVPPYSVMAGNPARLVKQYDPGSGQWVPVKQEVHDDDRLTIPVNR